MELVQATCWLVHSWEAGSIGLCAVCLWSLSQLLSALSSFADTAMDYVLPHEIMCITHMLSTRYWGIWIGNFLALCLFLSFRGPCNQTFKFITFISP